MIFIFIKKEKRIGKMLFYTALAPGIFGYL